MIVPAYILQVRYPVQPNRNKSFTFRDADLLAARQAAFQKAQQAVAGKSPDNAMDITIDLVEINRVSTSDKQQVIATIFQQRFHRTSFISEGKDLLLEMDRKSLVARSLPDSIFLTIDLGRDDEAFNTPIAVWDSLAGLHCEQEYYQTHGYSIGIGLVQLTIADIDISSADIKNAKAMSDEQLENYLTQIRHPRPYRTFDMLYDGLAYAASLVGQYNRYYPSADKSLSFNIEIFPQQ